jgi:prolyl-tRNA synthetase
MVESEAGEDEIFLCRLCAWSQNKEIAETKAGEVCPKCQEGVLERVNSIEVGNIFKLGTRFSEPINFCYKNKSGETKPVIMGSYGIGIERLMGTAVEVHHDERGIIWPSEIAPFKVHLLLIGEVGKKLKNFGEKVYNGLIKEEVEVLYDEREGVTAGEKFADADLIGIPYRVVVSEKTMIQDKIEVKKRKEKEAQLLKFKELLNLLK